MIFLWAQPREPFRCPLMKRKKQQYYRRIWASPHLCSHNSKDLLTGFCASSLVPPITCHPSCWERVTGSYKPFPTPSNLTAVCAQTLSLCELPLWFCFLSAASIINIYLVNLVLFNTFTLKKCFHGISERDEPPVVMNINYKHAHNKKKIILPRYPCLVWTWAAF